MAAMMGRKACDRWGVKNSSASALRREIDNDAIGNSGAGKRLNSDSRKLSGTKSSMGKKDRAPLRLRLGRHQQSRLSGGVA